VEDCVAVIWCSQGKFPPSHAYSMFLILYFKIFKEATLFFLGSIPKLSKVVPTMDYINKHLVSSSINTKYLLSIQASMLIGKQLLNNYYNMTDHSEVYQIAMGISILSFSCLLYLLTVFFMSFGSKVKT
jgi:hypothetical protein